jgi:hypothetical protein
MSMLLKPTIDERFWEATEAATYRRGGYFFAIKGGGNSYVLPQSIHEVGDIISATSVTLGHITLTSQCRELLKSPPP